MFGFFSSSFLSAPHLILESVVLPIGYRNKRSQAKNKQLKPLLTSVGPSNLLGQGQYEVGGETDPAYSGGRYWETT